MAFCQSCGKEVVENAVICVHCGVPRKVPGAASEGGRPTSVTVIAVLLFVGAGFGLLGLIIIAAASGTGGILGPTASVLFGIHVPMVVFVIHGLLATGVGVYCGIGLLKLNLLARNITIGYFCYSAANTLITGVVNIIRVSDMRFGGPPGAFIAGQVIGIIITLGIMGLFIYLLTSRGEHFTN